MVDNLKSFKQQIKSKINSLTHALFVIYYSGFAEGSFDRI
jgi:hypothetical protein